MITELEVLGFKVLKNCKLEALTRLTLIGGRNNSGKTTLLEAFFLSLDWRNSELLDRHLSWRGIEALELDPTSTWLPAFSELLPGKIQVKARGSSGDRSALTVQFVGGLQSTQQSSLGDRETAPSGTDPRLRIFRTKGSKTVFDAFLTMKRDSADLRRSTFEIKTQQVGDTAPMAVYLSSRMRQKATDDATHFGRLDQEKRTDALVEALQIMEPNLVGLSVVALGQHSQIYADVRGMPRKIPVNLLGDGFSRLLSYLLVLMARLDHGYLLIDEIEDGFHHGVLRDVWKVLHKVCREHRTQIIATTHSYECLMAYADALNEIAPTDSSFYRLDRKKDKMEVTRFGGAELLTAKDTGLEVR